MNRRRLGGFMVQRLISKGTITFSKSLVRVTAAEGMDADGENASHSS